MWLLCGYGLIQAINANGRILLVPVHGGSYILGAGTLQEVLFFSLSSPLNGCVSIACKFVSRTSRFCGGGHGGREERRRLLG